MGWGKERFDSPSYQQILRDVEMPMVPNNNCQKILRSMLGSAFNLHESFNCAGYVMKNLIFNDILMIVHILGEKNQKMCVKEMVVVH